MNKDIKIYFDDHVLVFVGKDTNIPANGTVLTFKNKKSLENQLEKFADARKDGYIYHDGTDEILELFKKCFKYIEAAGGLVVGKDEKILLIRRRGKWDLPKGKAEKGETPEETAVREVSEECGLVTLPQITEKLTDTYHVYRQNGKLILKHTVWYVMAYNGEEPLQPQVEEDITEAVWRSENELAPVLRNTYGTIGQVLGQWMSRQI
ncbi:MAG: NUDIX domain-containing protein [Bacteroidales bacterium]|jgi:8-oxo-dGTP pyrophosphatase MutT (NUDIX family)|nr:NUDIX domain-containing protein [Bacteroidales bacterium]